MRLLEEELEFVDVAQLQLLLSSQPKLRQQRQRLGASLLSLAEGRP
jgi:hypothetical protein